MEILNDIKNDIINANRVNRDDLKDGCIFPNRKQVTEITTNLLELVFPGYFLNCEQGNLDEHIKCITENTFYKLKFQISKAISSKDKTNEQIDNIAKEKTFTNCNLLRVLYLSASPTVLKGIFECRNCR